MSERQSKLVKARAEGEYWFARFKAVDETLGFRLHELDEAHEEIARLREALEAVVEDCSMSMASDVEELARAALSPDKPASGGR